MNRACLAFTLVAASSGVASAGTYLGLGIGTGPAVESSVGDLEADGRSGRLLLGSRWGNFALEGAVGGFDVFWRNGDPGDVYQASVAGKLSLPLSDGFEAFGRVGLQRTWLNHANEIIEADGTGYLLGAGIEYRLNLAVAAASIFVEYQYADATIVDGADREQDFSARMWTLGLTIGI